MDFGRKKETPPTNHVGEFIGTIIGNTQRKVGTKGTSQAVTVPRDWINKLTPIVDLSFMLTKNGEFMIIIQSKET